MPETAVGRKYEMMLLVEPTAAAKEWNRVVDEVTKTVEKYGAKVLLINKWGERRLAYRVKKITRGTFVLVYFEGPEDVPGKGRADFVLSEFIMRTIVVRFEGEVTEVTMPALEPIRPRPSRGRRYGG
ncbi:MAG: 30S ribosomal protein S6 [Planctomycetota bacterium]|jgi:small subunit ribosomal protein S6